MKQIIVLVIIAIVGAGIGAAIGITITDSKSKAAIADMQSKMQQSETAAQERIRNYDSIVNRLSNELQRANVEIERLKTPAPAAEEAIIAAAENEKTAAASEDSSITKDTKLYTIKSGDSLWTIAKNQLGSGDRFKEILELNPNISAESNLTIGSTLKIPAK